MNLYIAGVNHYDPMGRVRVGQWLRELSDRRREEPAFVAVEFDRDIFRALRRQRPQYREWIHSSWPGVPDEDLSLFELSLGYEGDTHKECFAGAEVVWLDDGRQVEPEVVDQHARLRLLTLRYFEQRNSLMLPGVVSEQVQGYTRPEVFSPDRSRRFAERILAQVKRTSRGWAVAITGASHASDRFENSMRSLLEAAGVSCEVRYFCRLPETTAQAV